jgi:hypothetical protein
VSKAKMWKESHTIPTADRSWSREPYSLGISDALFCRKKKIVLITVLEKQ